MLSAPLSLLRLLTNRHCHHHLRPSCPTCSIFLPYPSGHNASTIYASDEQYGFSPQPQGVPGGVPPAPYKCPQCTNASHYFWGVSTIIIDWPLLLNESTLPRLGEQGFRYRLTRFDFATQAPYFLAGNSPDAGGSSGTSGVGAFSPSQRPERVTYDVMGADWTLEGVPVAGWTPAWKAPATAAVVIISVFAALLLLLLLKAQRQHYSLLRRMLPAKVISKLQSGSGMFVESFDCVSVLFSDIVSYTSMAAAMSPQQVVEMLNDLYKAYDGIVEEEGAYKVAP